MTVSDPIKKKKALIVVGAVLAAIGLIGVNNFRIFFGSIAAYGKSIEQKAKAGMLFNVQTAPANRDFVPTTVKKIAPPKGEDVGVSVVDQFGKPVVEADVWFSDDQGKVYPKKEYLWSNQIYSTDAGGAVCCWAYAADPEKTDMPDGDYTIHISKKNYDQVETGVVFSSSATKRSRYLVPKKFILRKWGRVSAVVIDPAGKPNACADSFWLTDGEGKTFGKSTDFQSAFDDMTGRLETAPVPDGEYVLHIAYSCMLPSFNSPKPSPLERPVRVFGSDVFLGKLTFTGKIDAPTSDAIPVP